MTERTVVLQVLPSLVTGGVERSTVEMTRAIAEAGGIALVASEGGRLVSAVERAGGRHITLPLDRRNPLRIWRNTASLAAVMRAERVAIVHARSRAPAWSALFACRRTGAHFVTTYHGVYREDLPLKRRYNAVMASGERVIVASRFVADLIVTRHDADPARICVIPRGVDCSVFDPGAVSGERIARLARSWRLPEGVPVVLLPGRLTRWKGQTVLIDAVSRLATQEICCVLVGSDQGRSRYAGQLIRQAEALGVANRLRLAGECDDMPAALMLADVVVHASTEPEAFGRVVIEAQSMGRAVIASGIGGPVETVEEGVTGWRVPPGDADALAAAIKQALALPADALSELGFRARAAVQRHYTVEAMQAATLAVYDELLVGVAAAAA